MKMNRCENQMGTRYRIFKMISPGMTAIRWLVVLGLILVVTLFTIPMLTRPNRGYSFERQRKEQRKIMQERVKNAGGLAVLRRESESMFTNSSDDYFWYPQSDASGKVDYSAIPPALAQLQPREILFDPGPPDVVKIRLFGGGRTGMTSVPYYGLWFVRGAAPTNYTPALTWGPAHTVNKLEDRIFEAYE